MALRVPREGAARWTLTEQAFEALLGLLGPDRERAAERYESIRRKLTRVFAWRGFANPEELADATFDRVARKVDDGVDMHASDPYSYIHGVALRIAQEQWRADARARAVPEGLADSHAAGEWPRDAEPAATGEDVERRLQCLDECLGALEAGARELLRRYHGGSSHIADRRALAGELGISATALRLRAFRLRATVQECVRRCAERGRETEPAAPA
jgi:DNA-directed RNA polymerase specialized sigma24 family protein